MNRVFEPTFQVLESAFFYPSLLIFIRNIPPCKINRLQLLPTMIPLFPVCLSFLTPSSLFSFYPRDPLIFCFCLISVSSSWARHQRSAFGEAGQVPELCCRKAPSGSAMKPSPRTIVSYVRTPELQTEPQFHSLCRNNPTRIFFIFLVYCFCCRGEGGGTQTDFSYTICRKTLQSLELWTETCLLAKPPLSLLVIIILKL